MTGVAVYPGSFNPPTIAHLAISQAAVDQHGLTTVVWMLSERPLGKLDVEHPRFEDRLDVLEHVAAEHSFLQIETTTSQLLADIAEGFDLLIVGADKWHQIHEPHWYDGPDHQRQSLDRLPRVAVAPRAGLDVPSDLALRLEETHSQVSSSAARSTSPEFMLEPARSFAAATGAWLEPERYERRD